MDLMKTKGKRLIANLHRINKIPICLYTNRIRVDIKRERITPGLAVADGDAFFYYRQGIQHETR